MFGRIKCFTSALFVSGNMDQFTKEIHHNNYYNIVVRVIGILLGLVLIRVNISYLGASLYGLWVTIASISQWANFGDLGISNGLRNELSKAVANEDYERQLNLIKTAVIMLSIISVCLFIILSIVSEGLFLTNVLQQELRIPLYITNLFFCISFVLGISRTIAYSYQKSWYASLASASTVAFQIIGILFLFLISANPHLISFAFISGIGSILGNVAIICLLYYYVRRLHTNIKFVPSYKKEYRHSILNIGLQFFVLQVCCLILYATDSVIINKLFDSVSVAKYGVITQVYNTGDSLFSLLLLSLWSAATYAAEKKNYIWIRSEIRHLIKMWFLFILGVVVVTFMFNQMVHVWLGDEAFYYESNILIMFASFSILNAFGAIYVNVANGLGIIRLQMTCAIMGAIVNVPLSVFLGSYCNLGLSGIKLATIICCFGSMFLVPIQISNYLKHKVSE